MPKQDTAYVLIYLILAPTHTSPIFNFKHVFYLNPTSPLAQTSNTAKFDENLSWVKLKWVKGPAGLKLGLVS
eukprot:940627-Amphidinium_carterae.1